MRALTLFPTPGFIDDIANFVVLNKDLLALVYALRKNDPIGEPRSNVGGWHSKNLTKDIGFDTLTTLINGRVKTAAEAIGYANMSLTMNSSWVTVSPPGASNAQHVHSGALLSGAYYIQAEEYSSPLIMHDPRPQKVFSNPRETPKDTSWLQDAFAVKVQTGRLVIFPSWLAHTVPPNNLAKDRVVFSFNYSQA